LLLNTATARSGNTSRAAILHTTAASYSIQKRKEVVTSGYELLSWKVEWVESTEQDIATGGQHAAPRCVFVSFLNKMTDDTHVTSLASSSASARSSHHLVRGNPNRVQPAYFKTRTDSQVSSWHSRISSRRLQQAHRWPHEYRFLPSFLPSFTYSLPPSFLSHSLCLFLL